jgi:hypothetical protein
MKIMANHSSATVRETPHVTQSTKHETLNINGTETISVALKRRAESLIKDKSIDPQSRAVIRYRLETNDPWLAELVRRADAGETIVDTDGFLQTPATDEDDANEEKIEALAEIICGAGDASAAALLVLMGRVQNSTHPKAVANTVKHFAFTRCGELNLFGMVDAQIAVVESQLLASDALMS